MSTPNSHTPTLNRSSDLVNERAARMEQNFTTTMLAFNASPRQVGVRLGWRLAALTTAMCCQSLLGDPPPAPPTPPAGETVPGQPAVIHDITRTDPFCLRVERLMADGMPRAAAVAQASSEFAAENAGENAGENLGRNQEECLYNELTVLYCNAEGKIHRFQIRLNSKCVDDMWAVPGCTPLTCPPGVVPPAPCNLPTCASSGNVPMWDTTINPACFGLPATVTCAWVYPSTTTPEWGPCEKIIVDCSCFPEFASCVGLSIECRNPAAPKQANDPCPNCQ